MDKIKNIVFDLGGVIITISQSQAIERFKEIGVVDAELRLDPYTQTGIFGDLESGKIDAETFRTALCEIAGKEITHEQCLYAWKGYVDCVPNRNLEALKRLKAEGYKIILLSNTNPFMMEWATSSNFAGEGKSLDTFFDAMYKSYEHRMMKPNEMFFRKMLSEEHIFPEDTLFVDDGARNVAMASELGIRTFCPENGADWTTEIYKYLK